MANNCAFAADANAVTRDLFRHFGWMLQSPTPEDEVRTVSAMSAILLILLRVGKEKKEPEWP